MSLTPITAADVGRYKDSLYASWYQDYVMTGMPVATFLHITETAGDPVLGTPPAEQAVSYAENVKISLVPPTVEEVAAGFMEPLQRKLAAYFESGQKPLESDRILCGNTMYEFSQMTWTAYNQRLNSIVRPLSEQRRQGYGTV